jgi:virginiamycin B lyase
MRAILLMLPILWIDPTVSFAANEIPAEKLVVQAEIPRSGDFMGFGFDSLWMMSVGRLVRVNPADNSFIEIELEGSLGSTRGVGIGEGAVWIPDPSADMIYKVDPLTNKMVAKIPAAMLGSEGSIGVGEGAIWVVTEEAVNMTLTRFNSKTGAVEAKISLPSSGNAVWADYGSIWVTAGSVAGELYRIDPKTNAIASIVPMHASPRFIASGEDSLWVLNQGDGAVQRIDRQTGQVVATIETGLLGGGGDITTGGGYVWATAPTVPVAQVDPETNKLLRKFTGVGFGDAIRYGAGSLWVSGSAIHRIAPPN